MTTLNSRIPDSLYQQKERAQRGSWEKALQVLERVPDVEPDEHDRL